jgi:hypothetical protein
MPYVELIIHGCCIKAHKALEFGRQVVLSIETKIINQQTSVELVELLGNERTTLVHSGITTTHTHNEHNHSTAHHMNQMLILIYSHSLTHEY